MLRSLNHRKAIATITPYRRSAFWEFCWIIVIVSCGLAESMGRRFTLIAFAISVPYGFLLDRIIPLDSFDPTTLPEPPAGSVVEPRWKTALATLKVITFFIPFILAGIYYPVVGAIGGGGTLGLALGWLRVFLKVVSAETRDGWRLYFDVSRQWALTSRHRPSPNFRIPCESSSRQLR